MAIADTSRPIVQALTPSRVYGVCPRGRKHLSWSLNLLLGSMPTDLAWHRPLNFRLDQTIPQIEGVVGQALCFWLQQRVRSISLALLGDFLWPKSLDLTPVAMQRFFNVEFWWRKHVENTLKLTRRFYGRMLMDITLNLRCLETQMRHQFSTFMLQYLFNVLSTQIFNVLSSQIFG